MSSHSRVLRCCLVALFVWCVVAERASAAVARLAPDDQQSDEGEAQHEVTHFHDDGEYEHTYDGEFEPTAEAEYDAETGEENEEEAEKHAHTDVYDLRKLDDGQFEDLCGSPLLVKLFDLDGDMCKDRKHDAYEDYEESEEKDEEEYEEYYEY